MKKTFVEPALKRYDLRMKEEIVASWRPEDGIADYHFHFHQYDPATQSVVSDALGCYDFLDYYYSTAGEMTTRDSFLNFYTTINIEQRGRSGKEDNGYGDYGGYISACEYP